MACKPSSVPGGQRFTSEDFVPNDPPGGDHLSSPSIAGRVERPTRGWSGALVPLFGLAPDGVCPAPDVAIGAVSSYLAFSPLSIHCWKDGVFSVALSVGSPRPAVSGHPALWSSDFPLSRTKRESGRPAISRGHHFSTVSRRVRPSRPSLRCGRPAPPEVPAAPACPASPIGPACPGFR